jgi:hypothetical protein
MGHQRTNLLGLLVEQYLAFAETMAQQQKPMYMADWVERLDAILQLNGRELLKHAGKISHTMALQRKAGKQPNVFLNFRRNTTLITKKSLPQLNMMIKYDPKNGIWNVR